MTEIVTVSGNASVLAADSEFVLTFENAPAVPGNRSRDQGSSSFYSKLMLEDSLQRIPNLQGKRQTPPIQGSALRTERKERARLKGF